MIIETSCGRFYRVTSHIDADLAHLYAGVAVKKVKGQWINRAKARPEMIRKAATKVVEA
jgi:hypothetical protein